MDTGMAAMRHFEDVCDYTFKCSVCMRIFTLLSDFGFFGTFYRKFVLSLLLMECPRNTNDTFVFKMSLLGQFVLDYR